MAGYRVASVAFRFHRAGSIDPNPMTLVTKAGSAARLVVPGSTFVTIREESGLGHYFVAPDDGAQAQTAFALAQAVSARSEHVDPPPNLALMPVVAQLLFQRGSEPGNNTQAGADIGTVVDSIATSLLPGEWVAASVRTPSRWEREWQKRWLGHRSTFTHHSLNTNAVVMSLWVGALSTRNARALLRRVAGALPGFDLHTVQRAATAGRGGLPWLGVAAASGVGAALSSMLAPEVFWWTLAAAGVAVAAAGLTAAGRLPSKFSRLRRRMWHGLVPAAAKRYVPPKKPRLQHVRKDGETVPAFGGEYPLDRAAFMVGAALPLSIAAPHAGAESGVSATRDRQAPPPLRERVGPLVGVNHDLPVHLDAGDLWQGVFCAGKAGSGKSALLQALWGWMALDKRSGSGVPDTPGARHTLVGFDTKGDGLSAQEYAAWSEAAGDEYVRFDVADTATPFGIDLFPEYGSAKQRARRVVNAMRYVYGEQSIGPQSFDTLGRVLHAAYMVTPDVAAQVPGVNRDGSPFYFANILLTNRGDELGKELAGALIDAAHRAGAEPGSDLFDAADGLAPIYDPARTVAQRSQLVSAPKTKVAALLDAEHWWSRPQQTTWERVLTTHASVVVNTGIAPNGQTMDDELVTQMSALMLYSLREEIKRHCIGWFEQDRAVSIFADELKQLAGTSSDVVTWFRNDARSFGVRAVFATQYPEQLDRDVRDAVLGFGTFIAYSQSNPDMIGTIVKHLEVDGSAWSPADVDGLPKFHAIVKTQSDGTAQTPFTITIPNFRATRGAEFQQLQGFTA